jgi:hypothetical protein
MNLSDRTEILRGVFKRSKAHSDTLAKDQSNTPMLFDIERVEIKKEKKYEGSFQ